MASHEAGLSPTLAGLWLSKICPGEQKLDFVASTKCNLTLGLFIRFCSMPITIIQTVQELTSRLGQHLINRLLKLTIGSVFLLVLLDLAGAQPPLLVHPEVCRAFLPGLCRGDNLRTCIEVLQQKINAMGNIDGKLMIHAADAQ